MMNRDEPRPMIKRRTLLLVNQWVHSGNVAMENPPRSPAFYRSKPSQKHQYMVDSQLLDQGHSQLLPWTRWTTRACCWGTSNLVGATSTATQIFFGAAFTLELLLKFIAGAGLFFKAQWLTDVYRAVVTGDAGWFPRNRSEACWLKPWPEKIQRLIVPTIRLPSSIALVIDHDLMIFEWSNIQMEG